MVNATRDVFSAEMWFAALPTLKFKRKADNDAISATNLKVIKSAAVAIAEEISFLGAVIHLADTYLKVMEDNKEFLRDFLMK